jgi:hypothetical protein
MILILSNLELEKLRPIWLILSKSASTETGHTNSSKSHFYKWKEVLLQVETDLEAESMPAKVLSKLDLQRYV